MITCDKCGAKRPSHLFEWLTRNEFLQSCNYWPSEYESSLYNLPESVRKTVTDNRLGKYALCRYGCNKSNDDIARQDRLEFGYSLYQDKQRQEYESPYPTD